MFKQINKPLRFGTISIVTIFLTLGFSISLQSLLASWTSPSDIPPLNNVGDLLIAGSIGVGTNISVVGNSTFLGNVGIGTTTDLNALHIYRQAGDVVVKISTDGIGNPALDISAAAGRGGSIFFKEAGIEKGYIGHDPTNGALQFGDATNRARIILKEGGNTIFTGNTIDFNGQEIRHASYNPFYINSNDTIQFRINTNSTGGTGEFGVNRGNDNVRLFTVKDNGNVGVGVVGPTKKLDVNGDAKISGVLSLGKVQIIDVVTEGASCSSNGLIAADSTGLILSCQAGVWTKQGGSNVQSFSIANLSGKQTVNFQNSPDCVSRVRVRQAGADYFIDYYNRCGSGWSSWCNVSTGPYSPHACYNGNMNVYLSMAGALYQISGNEYFYPWE